MVVLGIPFNIYRYVPEAAARVCTLVTFKAFASEVLHSLRELTRRRQGGSTLRGGELFGTRLKPLCTAFQKMAFC